MKAAAAILLSAGALGPSVAPCTAFVGPAPRQHALRPWRVVDDDLVATATSPSLPSHVHRRRHHRTNDYPRGDVSVGLFRDIFKKIKGGGDEDEGGDGEDTGGAKSASDGSVDDVESTKPSAAPFFAAVEEEEVAKSSAGAAEEGEASGGAEGGGSPASQAEQLRAQAARIRLEADKRTVELTLEKISKLGAKLDATKGRDRVDKKERDALEEELSRLKSQIVTDEASGEVKPATPAAAPAAAAKVESSTQVAEGEEVDTAASRPSLSAEDVADRVRRFEDAPDFMKLMVARTLGYTVESADAVDGLNATDIVRKLHDDEMDLRGSLASTTSDFLTDSERESARSSLERAFRNSGTIGDDEELMVFTEEEVSRKIRELEELPDFVKRAIDKDFNNTEMAIMLLEQEYEDRKNKGKGFFGWLGGDESREKGEIGRDGERLDRDRGGSFSRSFPGSDDEAKGRESSSSSRDGGPMNLSTMVESLYPKSTRKEDEAPDRRTVDAFVNDIVGSTKAFTPSSEPISVPGGWLVRGTNECDSGAELIEKLDGRMSSDSRLREKVSFFLIKDPLPDNEDIISPLDWPQVLYVTGPDVSRDSQLILRTVISALGLATAWYGSVTPFLSNSRILDRATDAMELADAGMPADATWLSELPVEQLFFAYLALQLSHEVAHVAVAKAKGFDVSIPTLVPSILSGTTGSITSLKSPPKSRQDLLEFAVAGPLVGMIGSILVLCYGLVLTAIADAETVQMFPGLPLEILRQSSLGGGLIDLVLGNGVLNIPASSSEAAQALAGTVIALHPLAVAGFVSLFVNALAMVPAGRTDGGRISMAIFGRSGAQAVSFISLASLFVLGIQSDLILFYFSFLIFCQSELDIPMRNEIDDVDVKGVVLSAFAGFLMLLTLIPMS